MGGSKDVPGSMRLEADSLADSFRKVLEHLLVSQENLLMPPKNGSDLGEFGLDTSKAFIGSRC